MFPARSGLADALAAVGLQGRMETAQCCKSEFLGSGCHYVCGPRRIIKYSEPQFPLLQSGLSEEQQGL